MKLKLIDWQQLKYIKGNFKVFGFWSGLVGNITLMSPLLNRLINWKYRNCNLSGLGEM